MPNASVPTQELARLFLGDKLSLGYYHPLLVYELCRRTNPLTFERLRDLLFGQVALSEIDSDAFEVLREGYDWWQNEGRPKASADARG